MQHGRQLQHAQGSAQCRMGAKSLGVRYSGRPARSLEAVKAFTMISKHRARLVPLARMRLCHPVGWSTLTPYQGYHVYVVYATSVEQGGWMNGWNLPSLACRARWGIVDEKASTRLSPTPVLQVSGLGRRRVERLQHWKSPNCSLDLCCEIDP